MLGFVLVTVVKVIVVFAVLMLMVAYSTWLERRVLGRLQVRKGSNRVGPFGLLQPIADGLKGFFKEDLVPANVDKVLYVLAPVISIVPAIAIVAVIPFGDKFTLFGQTIQLGLADINVALLYILGLAGLGEYGVMLGGWSSNNKYGLLGSLRTAAQMISYELAMGMLLVSVIMVSGSLSLRAIVDSQAGLWNIIRQPVAFFLFLVCGLAEINRTPFDMPEAESELACGFNIEYSSMKFAMFFMAEYAHMISLAAIITCLFLGGWHPLPGLGFIPGIVWFLLKVFVVVFFFIWERGTFPRLRYDQIMHLGWKVLMPIALANIFVTGVVLTAAA
ncbi:MAG: NADH-quinone oxidoreductase subunit NuoH [Deltaproteobacteria bacterium]|nr:NADH-quinone oxidoreductase subunit NuoH [Deltaproteobacteria bacterium]